MTLTQARSDDGLVGRTLLYRDLVADNGAALARCRHSGFRIARTSFSGVAPLRSRFGSSIGFMGFSKTIFDSLQGPTYFRLRALKKA